MKKVIEIMEKKNYLEDLINDKKEDIEDLRERIETEIFRGDSEDLLSFYRNMKDLENEVIILNRELKVLNWVLVEE